MPSMNSLLAFLAAASLGQAHIEFVRIAHNGVWQPPLKYIRNRTAYYQEPGEQYDSPWTFPVYPSHQANSVRCGRDNLAWASQTDTLKVSAGDEVEWLASNASPFFWGNTSQVQWDNCPNGKGGCAGSDSYYPNGFGIAHDGPVSMFLSPVPSGTDIKSYDGSGQWVKFFTLGVEFRVDTTSTVTQNPSLFWLPLHDRKMAAKIPRQTPPGKYLLRVHQNWAGANPPQIYPACAHVEVVAATDVQANPLPVGVKIPEAMCRECPGMNYNWTSGQKTWVDVLNGTEHAGGLIWDGETSKPDVIVPIIKDWYDSS